MATNIHDLPTLVSFSFGRVLDPVTLLYCQFRLCLLC